MIKSFLSILRNWSDWIRCQLNFSRLPIFPLSIFITIFDSLIIDLCHTNLADCVWDGEKRFPAKSVETWSCTHPGARRRGGCWRWTSWSRTGKKEVVMQVFCRLSTFLLDGFFCTDCSKKHCFLDVCMYTLLGAKNSSRQTFADNRSLFCLFKILIFLKGWLQDWQDGLYARLMNPQKRFWRGTQNLFVKR